MSFKEPPVVGTCRRRANPVGRGLPWGPVMQHTVESTVREQVKQVPAVTSHRHRSGRSAAASGNAGVPSTYRPSPSPGTPTRLHLHFLYKYRLPRLSTPPRILSILFGFEISLFRDIFIARACMRDCAFFPNISIIFGLKPIDIYEIKNLVIIFFFILNYIIIKDEICKRSAISMTYSHYAS